MKHNHSHIPLVILGTAVVLVVVAMYVYMYGATQYSIADALQSRDALAQEQRNESSAKVFFDVATKTEKDRRDLETHIISSLDMISFITSLESISTQSGAQVSITSVATDVKSASVVGSIGKAQAHVVVAGTWTTVMRALGLAEHLPFAGTIDHVRLSKGGDAKSAWEASFDVQAPVYVASSTLQ